MSKNDLPHIIDPVISRSFGSEREGKRGCRMNLSTRLHRGSIPFFLLLFGIIAWCSPELHAQTTVPEWRSITPLPTALDGHRATLLPTGDVLITGGIAGNGTVSRTSLLYSATTGTYRPTGNQLNTPRSHHLLIPVVVGTDTKVFAIGGFGGSSGNYPAEPTIEVLEYDAPSDTWRWRPAGRLPIARGDLRGEWDGGTWIVTTGGYASTGGPLRSGPRSTAAARINVVTGAVEALPAMNDLRAEHTVATIIDDNDNVVTVVAGGEASATTATQILEGTTWNSIANPPVTYRTAGVGFGDRAAIARSFGGFDDAGVPIDACEWYDVKRGWRNAPRLNDPRARFDMTLIAGTSDTADAYLAAAGVGVAGDLRSTEIFEMPNASLPNGVWTPFLDLVTAGSERQLAINGANLPVLYGGRRNGSIIADAEVLQPLRASDVRFPDEEVGRRSDSIQLGIRNEWLLPVQVRNFRVAGSAAFFFTGDTSDFVIPAGGTRTIRLYFQPGTPGPHTGELLFDVGELTDRVRLDGNAVASTLAVINSPFDAGEVFVRDRLRYCYHILRNDGTDTATIDSVSVDPAGTFRVVSPRGRASIPPGDSLEVCLEFAPGARGEEAAAVRVHLAGRTFPGQTIARGVRRYVTASTVTAGCDTITYEPGSEVSGFIRLENPGDSVVTVSNAVITQSALNLFRLADPTQLPIVLLPGESVLLEVIFAPVRESRETATIAFTNDGDTAAAVDLCFVARSRFLQPSQSTVDFGEICVGDSIETTLVLENPGGFDLVDLISADATPAAEITIEGFSPVTLGPRQVARIQVRWKPTGPGPLVGTLRVANSRGDLLVPIEGTALSSARFAPQDTDGAIGEQVIVPVDVTGLVAGTPVTTATLSFEYDATMTLPLAIRSLPGGPAVDENASGVVVDDAGRATLSVVFAGGGPTVDGPAFGIETEMLRGEASTSRIEIEGLGSNAFCLVKGVGRLDALPPCWGPAGGIRTAKATGLYVRPLPAAERLTVILLNRDGTDEELELLDATGRRAAIWNVLATEPGTQHLELDLPTLPSGLYLLRTTTGEPISTTVVVR